MRRTNTDELRPGHAPEIGPEDRAFERYRRHGKPRDLADVYDATAAELLRVALHLTSSPTDAEDLVQATFLTAIERRHSFEPGRRVQPWLLGILTMRAKRLPRERRRPDAERLREPVASNPLRESEDLELNEAVDRAIEDLPDAYRPVLRLRLRHGMAAAKIAHALGRPSGTVRTQIVRGIAILRDKLPPSFATWLVGLGIGQAGLRGNTAIREAVLREAARHAPLPLAASGHKTLLGAWLVKKTALVVAIVLFALGAYLFTSREGPTISPLANDDSESAVHAEASARPSAGERTPARITQDDALPDATHSSLPKSTSLRVELAWSEAGGPASGVGVTLIAVGQCSLSRRSASSGPDGLVLFADIASGRYRISTDRDGKTDAKRTAVHVETGSENHCRLVLRTGPEISGVVVDERGRAVANAEIYLSGGDGGLYDGQVVARTSGDGRFVLQNVRGRRFVAARAPGYAPASRVLLEEPVKSGRHPDLRIVLPGPGSTMTGRVLGPAGEPVRHAAIVIGWPLGFDTEKGLSARLAPSARTRTDAEGRFELESLPTGRHRTLIRAQGLAPHYEYVDIRPGRADRTFHLRRGVVLRGRVTDTRGRPIAGARVAATGFANLSAAARTDRDGRYRLDALHADRLSLTAKATGFDEHRTVRTPPLDTKFEWSPVLRSTQVCTGHLRMADGRVVAGAKLRAVSESRSIRGSTDDEGAFRLSGLREKEIYAIYASPPDESNGTPRFSLCRSAVPIRAGAKGLDLRLANVTPKSARITARLSLSTRQPMGADCVATLHQLGPGGHVLSREFADASPAFPNEVEVAGLVPGDYRLWISSETDRFPEFYVSIPALRAGERRDLGSVRPPAAATLTVEATGADRISNVKALCEVRGADADLSIVRRFTSNRVAIRLAAGNYTVIVFGHGIVSTYHRVEVRAGVDERLRVEFEAGARRQLILRPPRGVGFEEFEISVKNDRGVRVASDRFDDDVHWPHSWWPALAPGVYTTQVRCTDAKRTGGKAMLSGKFVIEDIVPRLAPVLIELK